MGEKHKPLYIIGASGFGRESAWLVEKINQKYFTWDIKGFIDDDRFLWGQVVDGYEVLGGCESLSGLEQDFYIVCAVGSAAVRKKIISRIVDFKHLHFATLIDPDIAISSLSEIGEGSIICSGTKITVDVTIGRHNIINLNCTIGHDVVLEDYVTLYPGVNVSGNVRIASVTELGTGVQVIQGLRIVSHTILGAGAVIIKDICESGTYVGIPARKLPLN